MLTLPSFRRPRDVRALAFVFVAISVAALAYLVTLLPSRGVEASLVSSTIKKGSSSGFSELTESSGQGDVASAEELAPSEPRVDPRTDPVGHVRQARAAQATALLAEGVALIKAARYDEAVEVINRAGPLSPDDARAYLHMGYALKGRGDFAAAKFFFERAVDLEPTLSDAYLGFAEAAEGLGDLESALGAMRSFLHVVKDADPYRLKVAQARSAIWEWEAQLGRGPWGPTKGIPPGFTAEEVRRDGRGVGVKMPLPDTLQKDGTMKYEIKAGDRFPGLFKP